MAQPSVSDSVSAMILFLCYINDLSECVSSTAGLFADDCVLHRVINSHSDAERLQRNTSHLSDQLWNMLL